MKTDISGFDITKLENAMQAIGEKPFRGRQIACWIYKHNIGDFRQMSNLSTSLRYKLKDSFVISKLKAVRVVKDDRGIRKTLWKLGDGETIESVLIPDEDRLTLCISSQAGCPLRCGFCATGFIGYKRNLTAGEIVNQFLQTKLGEGERVTNIVFMGMGEPLLNFDNLRTALGVLTDDLTVGFGAKKITVSTAGIPEKIKALADIGLKVGLAFSLNAADDELRGKLMPINHRYKLDENYTALKYFQKKTGRRITFEYVLFKGINDSIKDAVRLVSFVHDIPCKINLIKYNPIDNSDFIPPDDETVFAFRDYLYSRAPAVTLRESKGTSIAAACGQLKGSYSNKIGVE